MDLAHDAEEAADKLDGLVQPAGEPENAVLVDNARVVRWTGPAFALFSLILLPWTIYLGYSLPARQVSSHYDVAWAGFDILLLAMLASTAFFALRRSRYLATAATATATLLVIVPITFSKDVARAADFRRAGVFRRTAAVRGLRAAAGGERPALTAAATKLAAASAYRPAA